MNIKILHSWLKEYLHTEAKPSEIAECLSLSGPSVEHLEREGNDFSYDIEVTTNRIDAASTIGIAREANAALHQHKFSSKFKPLTVKAPAMPNRELLKLKVSDPHGLSRKIMAVVLDNITIASSSAMVKKRLKTAGIRSINNVIDITNYIMLEVGHPAHVFDYDQIATGTLLFRNAKNKEKIITLDGQTHQLSPQDVVIDDGTGRIIDLPGIMGAENSMVTEKTKKVVLFLEMNEPSQIRKTSMRLGIRTLAATYNENSPDKQTAQACFYRGISLLQEWANGRVASQLIDIDKIKDKPKQQLLPLKSLENYLNVNIPLKQIKTILVDLGFEIIKATTKDLLVNIPSHRKKDINIAADLVEEISRVYGYQNLGSSLPPFYYYRDPYLLNLEEYYEKEKLIRAFFSSRGSLELCNYSMLSKEYHDLFPFDQVNSLQMNNPLSNELVYFRQTILPSLVKAVEVNKGIDSFDLFEIGPVYLPRSGQLPEEKIRLGLLSTESYAVLMGKIEALLTYGNSLALFASKPGSKRKYLDSQLSSTLYLDNLYLGEIGQLDYKIKDKLKLEQTVYIAELDLQLLAKYLYILKTIKPIVPQTTLIEDLTYTFDGKHYYSQIKQALLARFKRLVKIEFVTCFDNFYTIRLYTQVGKGTSILRKIVQFLEDGYNLKIKRVKDDNNKSKKV